jgi:hypothetical protein
MFIQNLPFKGYLYAAIALNLASAAVIAITVASLPPLVPLFYGLPVGQGQLINSWGLLIAPGTSLAISLANAWVAHRLEDVFLKKIMAAASFFVSLLSTITVTRIILLVGFW